MKKIIAGVLVSALFIYLSIKGTDFRGVMTGLEVIGYVYILPFLLISLLMQILRSWRWGLIISPLGKIGPLPLFAITSVGFLAVTALPARLGELGRPYLLSRNSPIKMSAALGTIFVERILDGVTILTIALIVPFFTPLPAWLIRASIFFLLANGLLITGVYCAVFRRQQLLDFLNFFLRRLPEKWSQLLAQLLGHFLDGFRIIGNGKQLLQILALSLLIWLVNALAIYTLFTAFAFSLPPVAALVLMIILLIGIAIPTAPGFIGNWHFSCVLGLSLFGIAKTPALTFALIYHFAAVSFTLFLGVVSFPYLNFSFSDLWKEAKSTLTS